MRVRKVIKLPFGVMSAVGPKKDVLDGVQITCGQGAVLGVLMPIRCYGVFHRRHNLLGTRLHAR